jgi:hypothetical protein
MKDEKLERLSLYWRSMLLTSEVYGEGGEPAHAEHAEHAGHQAEQETEVIDAHS